MPRIAIKQPVCEIRLIDAPPDLAALFLAWIKTGRPYEVYHALEEALWGFRRTWLIAGDWVFWLSSTMDVIDVQPRSIAYPRNCDDIRDHDQPVRLPGRIRAGRLPKRNRQESM